MTITRNSIPNIPVLTRYPRFMDIDTASPPVSPSVVANIFMIQKARVTSGTLLSVSCFVVFTSSSWAEKPDCV
jgi:hypothetical protein